MNRGGFLDRDGVLNEDRGYVHRVEDVTVFPGAGPALKRLQNAGFLLFIVTNQSGIGRGYYTVDDMHRVNAYLLAELARDGVQIARLYFAPEAPEQPSRGRKPSPQFLFDARDQFALDLSQCYLVGDKRSDLECGWNAGVRESILVRTGYGAKAGREADGRIGRGAVVDDLPAAVAWILEPPRRAGQA
jgi:D-glycero-D-manno-heptose 1,7-bisphosphate phosphatase